jgi:hypothetical protein
MSMRPLQRWLLGTFLAAPLMTALGCECGNIASAPACEKISTAQIVFVGTVRAIEPDPRMPGNTGAPVYRFEVETVYKGLPANTRDIIVDPDNLTSCHAVYKQAQRYLVFASRDKGTEVVSAGGCSGSRLAKYAADDLRFLDAYRNNQARNFVYGSVVQRDQPYILPNKDEDAAVEGATVFLRNDALTLKQETSATGEFRFEGLPAGSYSLSASRAPYNGDPAPLSISVPAVGCVQRQLLLQANASISGILRTVDGAPASKMDVELLRRNALGKWSAYHMFRNRTDDAGRFRFKELPDGDYLLGYGIGRGRIQIDSAYPTRYYPGVAEQAQATIIHLAPTQFLTNLDFTLAEAQAPRQIRIVVVWPDGSAPAANRLDLWNANLFIKGVGGPPPGNEPPPPPHHGIVEFRGYAERTYNLRVRYWIDDPGGPVPYDQQRVAYSETVRLDPGRDPATVKLVLTKTMLAVDDR